MNHAFGWISETRSLACTRDASSLDRARVFPADGEPRSLQAGGGHSVGGGGRGIAPAVLRASGRAGPAAASPRAPSSRTVQGTPPSERLFAGSAVKGATGPLPAQGRSPYPCLGFVREDASRTTEYDSQSSNGQTPRLMRAAPVATLFVACATGRVKLARRQVSVQLAAGRPFGRRPIGQR